MLIKKVVNLGRILHKIDTKMDKVLSERLYRHQEFCTLPTEIWAPTSYLRLCRLTNVVARETFIPFLQSIGLYEELFDPQDTAVDSFLASVSLSLMNLIQCGNLPDQYVEALRLSGIKEQGKITDTSYALIPILHNELTNGQREIYDVVLAGDDLNRQAENMLKGAGISTSLRDTLPLVVANALNLMVIIIPMSQGLPLLPVFPENAMVIDDPIFLLFENSENGRYTAINFDDQPEPDALPIITRCRCGANDKKVKKRCGAGIRCSCRANKTTCSYKCGCVGCTNSKPKKTYSKKRKRFHESLSQHPNVKSYDAAYHYGEAIPGAPINVAQHFLLEANLYVFLCETKTVLKNLDDEYVSENILARYLEMCAMFNHLDDSRNKSFVNRLRDQLERETIYRWVRSRKKKENLVIEFNSACALEEVTICDEETPS